MTSPVSASSPTHATHMRRHPHRTARVSREGTMKVFVNPNTSEVTQASRAPGPGFVEATSLDPAKLASLVSELEGIPERVEDLRHLKTALCGT